MSLFNVLSKVLDVLFVVHLVYLIWLSLKKRKRLLHQKVSLSNVDTPSKLCWSDYFAAIMIVFTMLTFLIAILIAGYRWKLYWIILIFGIPYLLRVINISIESTGIVGSIVKSSNETELSMQETSAIFIVTTVFYSIIHLDLHSSVLNWVSQIDSTALSNLLICLPYLILYFMIIFLCCALMPTPLQLLGKLYRVIICCFPQCVKNAYRKSLKGQDDSIRASFFTPGYVSFAKCRRKILRVALFAILPLVVVLDYVVTFFAVLLMFWLEGQTYLVRILAIIKRGCDKLSDIVIYAPYKRVIAISFRIAFVLAFSITVVVNHIAPIFSQFDVYTPVFEFIASALVIPVIFESIISVINKRKET